MFSFGPPANLQARREWWRRQIQRQRGSNITVAEFCRRLGASPVTFYAWKRRLRQTAPASPLVARNRQPRPTADSLALRGTIPPAGAASGRLRGGAARGSETRAAGRG